jgi:hypothetical protein
VRWEEHCHGYRNTITRLPYREHSAVFLEEPNHVTERFSANVPHIIKDMHFIK